MKKYKIAATLAYGRKLSSGFLATAIVGIAASVLMIPLLIFGAITSNQYEVLLGLIMPLIALPGLSYSISIYRGQNCNIAKWAEDAVLLTAQATETDRIYIHGNHMSKIKISVTFTFNGKKMTQKSGDKNTKKSGIFHLNAGYDVVFCKYVDRPIKILYSPQYDQVMILKMKK